MTRASDADLGQGSVYILDPARLIVRCTTCHEVFEYNSPPIDCPQCGATVSADHVQREQRPVILMTDTSLVPKVSVVTVVPVTTTAQPPDIALEFQGGVIPGIPKTSYVLLHQLRAINKASFSTEQKRGVVSATVLAILKARLRKYFGM